MKVEEKLINLITLLNLFLLFVGVKVSESIDWWLGCLIMGIAIIAMIPIMVSWIKENKHN